MKSGSPRTTRRMLGAGAVAALAVSGLTVATSSGADAAVKHVENPYVGAIGYVNPNWAKQVKAEAAKNSSLAAAMKVVAKQPTAVWMDRIAAIKGGKGVLGMQAHLDKALALSKKKKKPVVIEFSIYDLPGRDCAALASNGELKAEEIDRYKKEFIDPIVKIQKMAKYNRLRIVNIIEIDSLPNLVTNAGSEAGATDACRKMLTLGNYEKGIAYALGELHKAGANKYSYIDAAHHGWIGWDSNFTPSAKKFVEVAKMAEGGVATVDGFITATANYSALDEPFVQPLQTLGTGGMPLRSSKWLDWNDYSDERTFAKGFREELIAQGMDSGIGMLIDTSRNGWGGPDRPTAASTSTEINTYVEESRIDRRIHAGNWCNQVGAGIGERPTAAPDEGIDAFVWIKPPGESDGASKPIDNDQGKGFDGMCDPKYAGNGRNGNSMSGAMADAPLAGAWFSKQFVELVKNAYPPLTGKTK